MKTTYPITFAVDYPDRDLNRLTTAFRIIAAIPIPLVLSLLTGASVRYVATTSGTHETVTTVATGAACCFSRSC